MRIPYKELNSFINSKVEQAFKKRVKANKENKAKKAKKAIEADISVNSFERFRNLEVADSGKDNDDNKLPAIEVAFTIMMENLTYVMTNEKLAVNQP